MTRIRTYLLIMLLPFFLFSAQKLQAGTTGHDTVRTKVLTDLQHQTPTSRNSVIESMSDEQLTRLIDMLFELDSIPYDLAGEITRVVRSRMPDAEIAKVVDQKEAIDFTDSMPATNYYSVWDDKHVTCIFDLLQKNDTSFVLELTNDKLGKYTHPFSGEITSWFGWRDSTNHNGIDIDLNKGDPVVAAFEGKVRIAQRAGGFGNVVIIRHYNGLETVYGHLSKIKVKSGQVVRSGQVIGLGGSTGHSTGSHLHFEMRFKGIPINPVFIVSLKTEDLIATDFIVKKTRWGMTAYPFDAQMYTVQKGDKLMDIAKRFNTTTKSLRQMNAVRGSYMYLRVGAQIRVG